MSLPRFSNGYQGSRGHAAGLLFKIAGEINRALNVKRGSRQIFQGSNNMVELAAFLG